MKKLSLILASILIASCSVAAGAREIPRDTSFTLYSTAKKVLRKHSEATVFRPAIPQDIRVHRDMVYSTLSRTPYGKRELHADVFRPDNDSIYPALIMIHGGGWNSGDKSLQEPMAVQIARRGYVTVPIEYRLIPEALYPAALHDVKAAIRWARANAGKLGIDADRIAVAGCSAGAQLATLAGVTNGSKRHEGKGGYSGVSSDVMAVINIDGIATFVSPANIADTRSRFETKHELPVNAKWLGGLYDDASENWHEASPLEWVSRRSAPICFINSELPRYSDGRDELVARYDSLGIYSERHRTGAPIHPFWFFNPWAETTTDYVAAFLDRVLKRAETVKEYRITDYGVSADSTVVQTAAIQSVIDRAEADGGGEIVVPQGTFLSGALFFKPGTSLRLEHGAVLKGSDNIADYPILPSRMEGRSIYYHAALVNAYHVDNFRIEGPGTIDGNGFKFWTAFWDNVAAAEAEGRAWTNLEVRRPRLLFLWGCDGARVRGVRLINSAFWTSHYYLCNNLTVENCYIYAPAKPVRAPSSDAIDLDGCHGVTIRGCTLDTDDDGVCIKGGKGVTAHLSHENNSVTDVLVEGCVFGPNLHGTLTFGSECFHASDVVLRNCRLDNDCALLRLKMRPDTYQTYENISIENVSGRCGNMIEILPWRQFFDLEGHKEQPSGTIRNITMRNLSLRASSLGIIAGNAHDTVDNFLIENVSVKAPSRVFRCNYPPEAVRLVDVLVRGKAPEIMPADEEMKASMNYDAGDL